MSKKQYQIFCIDPPYSFSDKLEQSDVARGAEANYSTMSISDIKQLPIKDLADPAGAIMALWVPSSLIKDGLDIMEAYGFKFKQTWIWVKIKNDPFKDIKKKIKKKQDVDFDNINWDNLLSFGMGRLGRNVHEVALIGTRGKIYSKIKNKSQRTVFFYKNTKHSMKPEALQDRLELMFPNANYLEVFGRRLRNNWDVIGNQSPSSLGEDIKESLAKLLI